MLVVKCGFSCQSPDGTEQNAEPHVNAAPILRNTARLSPWPKQLVYFLHSISSSPYALNSHRLLAIHIEECIVVEIMTWGTIIILFFTSSCLLVPHYVHAQYSVLPSPATYNDGLFTFPNGQPQVFSQGAYMNVSWSLTNGDYTSFNLWLIQGQAYGTPTAVQRMYGLE